MNLELATGVSPSMLAALMETVVVAEARYLGPDSDTSICSARLDKDLKLETRNLNVLISERNFVTLCIGISVMSLFVSHLKVTHFLRHTQVSNAFFVPIYSRFY